MALMMALKVKVFGDTTDFYHCAVFPPVFRYFTVLFGLPWLHVPRDHQGNQTKNIHCLQSLLQFRKRNNGANRNKKFILKH